MIHLVIIPNIDSIDGCYTPPSMKRTLVLLGNPAVRQANKPTDLFESITTLVELLTAFVSIMAECATTEYKLSITGNVQL